MLNKKLGKNPLEAKETFKDRVEAPQTTLFKEVIKPLTSLDKIKEMQIKVDWAELAKEILGPQLSIILNRKLKGFTKLIGIMVVLSLLGACNTTQRQSEEAEVKKQLVDLQKLQSKQMSQIEELNNRILLLGDKLDSKEKNHTANKVTEPDGVLDEKISEKVSEKAPGKLLITTSAGKSGDLKLYERAMSDLKNNSFDAFKKDTELLSKGFKDSPLTSNALFILGNTYYKKSDFSNAAKTFEKLYSTNPDGNRAVSTLFYLGLSYQKLGRIQEAKEAYQSIVNIYPGSREALASSQKLASFSQRRVN